MARSAERAPSPLRPPGPRFGKFTPLSEEAEAPEVEVTAKEEGVASELEGLLSEEVVTSASGLGAAEVPEEHDTADRP